MYNRHPWPLKKSKSWGPFWSYQLNSTANSAYLPRKWAKWAELAVLFSWQLQNSPQDFDFFNGHGCRLFIQLIFNETCAPQFNGHNNSFLDSVDLTSKFSKTLPNQFNASKISKHCSTMKFQSILTVFCPKTYKFVHKSLQFCIEYMATSLTL